MSRGQDAPAEFHDADRVVVTSEIISNPTAVISLLRKRSLERVRSVIELQVDLQDVPTEVISDAPHQLAANTRLLQDELSHLVYSNSVDFRKSPPVFAPVELALKAGARQGGPADVLLPDGTPVWIDGGPIQHMGTVEGYPVIHEIVVEHGRLQPFGSNEVPPGVLAPDQLAAVTHIGGPARIIAPAGSGKTRVLTERARHIVNRWGLPSAAVSLVAFNRRAQNEMAERTDDVRGLQVRTLNAIALAIVNGSPPFHPQADQRRTIDEPQVRRLLGGLVKVPKRRNIDPLGPWLEALRAIRLQLQPPDVVEARFGGDVDGLTDVWPQFEELLDSGAVIDFDHQIYLALRILLTDPVARRRAQRASAMLLVDEFQDLTPAHLLLVRLLAGPRSNVFGVGDDDQTIYGFQGATPGWLIQFSEIFPGAGDHPLEVNYRCPAPVVDAARNLLKNNLHRVPKNFRSADLGEEVQGAVVVELSGTGPDSTVNATFKKIQIELNAGVKPSEVAVLTRVNALLAPIQVILQMNGIPVRGGVGEQFLSRTAVRAIFAWFRLARPDAPIDGNDLVEALRRPSRTFSPNVQKWILEQESVADLDRLANRIRDERDASKLRGFITDIKRVQDGVKLNQSSWEIVDLILRQVGVSAAIETLDIHRYGTNTASQSDDVLVIEQLAKMYPNPQTFVEKVSAALRKKDEVGGVTLSTVHRVKGLEWPVVFVHQVDRDQFPHKLAEDAEEERRIFHVAITRAGRRVYLIAGENPSRYLSEIRGIKVDEPIGQVPAPRRLEQQPTARGMQVGDSRDTARADKAKGPLRQPNVVLAAVGLEILEGGVWRIIKIHDSFVEVRQGQATREFKFGKKVTTVGKQKGILMAADDGIRPESIRAFDLLRQIRDSVRGSKPAYIVFHDSTLEQIALALPRSLRELSLVNGVGPTKLELYGDAVLTAIEQAFTPDESE